jgi:hypothetical protein
VDFNTKLRKILNMGSLKVNVLKRENFKLMNIKWKSAVRLYAVCTSESKNYNHDMKKE